jgi:hypothetical protein
MKWIGQHIWDYISRFRNDVYLEDVSTGTIASGGNLGLDSNNKIVKAASPAGTIDLTSEVTGTLPVGNGGTGVATVGTNELVTGNGSSPLTSEANLKFSNEVLVIGADDNGSAYIQRDSHSDGNGGPLEIKGGSATAGQTDKSGGSLRLYSGAGTGTGNFGTIDMYTGADSESTGTALNTSRLSHQFIGGYGSSQLNIYSLGGSQPLDMFQISVGEDAETTISTTENGGGSTAHLDLQIDGDIILDSASGNIKTGSTTFVNNSGVIQVATQGTIDHDSLANFVANEHIDWTGDVSASSVIHTNNITDLHGAGVDGSANQLLTDDGDGTVTSESGATWNGGTLALTSADTGCAAISLTATADGNKPTNFGFIKNRASSTALADDFIGFTSWISDNAGGTTKTYAEQYVQAAGVVAGDEFARVIHTCATSTGTVSTRQNMITGLGSASANTVNTTLGYGVESTCTIAGDVVLEGDQLRVSGSSTQSARIALSEDADNGTDMVVLAAPAATSGQTITLPDATGTVQLQGVSAGKQLQAFSCNFYDNISTTTHYLPFKDINEQTYAYQDEVSMLAPCDGRVVSVTLRPHSVVFASDSTLTVQVHTKPANDNIYATWTAGESEAIVAQATDDHHVFHFAFSNAKHFDSTESFNVSLNSSVAAGGSSFWYVTIVVEWDWTTFLGETSAEYDAAP